MQRKRNPIVLSKLVDESVRELPAMVAELSSGKQEKQREGAKPSRWGRRFAASGKRESAPKVRPR
jgi:hypothetical protein